MTIDYLARYAVSHPGKYDRAPFATARFVGPDGTSLHRRVPSPAHVAQHLTAPALTGSELSTIPDRVEALVASMPPRTSNGRGGNVSDHYLGLRAAAQWKGPPDFDRDAYIAAIVDATLTLLRRTAERDARAAARTQKCPRAVTASAPAMSAAEVKARFNSARVAREREYARASIRELLELNEVQPGDTVTRAELVDAVLGDVRRARKLLTNLREDYDAAQTAYIAALRDYDNARADWEQRKRMQPGLSPSSRPRRPRRPVPIRWADKAPSYGLPASLPPSFGARRAASLVIEIAREFGLIERRSGNVRRYVYAPGSEAIDATPGPGAVESNQGAPSSV